MKFQPERLIQLRNTLNINKAEAARRLNISPMVYGRYENGQREPSYPTVGFIAQTFNCNIDFLYGTSDKTDPDYIIVSSSNDPELYSLINIIKQDSKYLYIATNNHVVADADSLKVQFVDNETVECKVQGTDASDDLAVVKVALSDIKDSTLKEIKVATVNEDTDTLEVGQGVIAIGNALGYGQSVTNGIISALGRTVTVQDEQTGETVVNNTMIQTNAAINPGNSGGALLNASGEVVGINSAKYSDTSVEGFGYAIPMSDAMPIVEQLIEKGQVDQSKAAFLGIQGQDISSSVASAYNMPQGVYVYQVVSGSPAEKAGLRQGDIITEFDGQTITGMTQLKQLIASHKSGDEVKMTMKRLENGYKEKSITVTLAAQSDFVSESSSDNSNDSQNSQDSGNSGDSRNSENSDNSGNSGFFDGFGGSNN